MGLDPADLVLVLSVPGEGRAKRRLDGFFFLQKRVEQRVVFLAAAPIDEQGNAGVVAAQRILELKAAQAGAGCNPILLAGRNVGMARGMLTGRSQQGMPEREVSGLFLCHLRPGCWQD